MDTSNPGVEQPEQPKVDDDSSASSSARSCGTIGLLLRSEKLGTLFVALATLFSILAVALQSQLSIKTLGGGAGSTTTIGAWAMCRYPPDPTCGTCLSHLRDGDDCKGLFTLADKCDTTDFDSGPFSCSANKHMVQFIKASGSMAVIGMSVFVFTCICVFLPTIFGKPNPCSKSLVVIFLIVASVFDIVAMAVWAGGCPCNWFDDPTECATKGGSGAFCLLYLGNACTNPLLTQAYSTANAHISPGGAFASSVIAWVFGLIAAIILHLAPADSNVDQELLQKTISTVSEVRQKLSAMDGQAAIQRCASAHQLFAAVALLIDIDVLDHGSNPYGRFSTYPSGSAPLGAFYPFTGPFSPLLAMLTIIFAAMGKMGMSRNWLNFLVSYNLFCMITSMLFLWYAGNIFYDNSSTAGHNARCPSDSCSDIVVVDDDTAPQCLARGNAMGVFYMLQALVSMLACFMFGKQANFADLGRVAARTASDIALDDTRSRGPSVI